MPGFHRVIGADWPASRSGRFRSGPASALLRWEDPLLDQPFAERNAEWGIHVEHSDRDTTDRRSAKEIATLPAKMPHPLVPARVEQRCELLRPRVPTGDVSSFITIAPETT